ncbi:MAG: class I SAM-dependent methyltransferase [Nostocaceae cyanobacterium]|nr:class I SAM-dependent methyltransferase [Nostocaceae cyanobacterium]
MSEKEPQELRQKIKLLVDESLRQSDPSGWFEPLYTQANGDPSQVPWANLTTSPHLEEWLDNYLPQGDRGSALVIGCGLGDDAEALQAKGFKVTAFDISSTAIAWCQQRFPNSQVEYQVADLLALPSTWHGAFDFVFESRTIQSLPLNIRSQVIDCVGQLVADTGTLLVITHLRDNDSEPDGPPWALSEGEIAQFTRWGLQEIRRHTFFEGENNAVTKIRIEYRKNVVMGNG